MLQFLFNFCYNNKISFESNWNYFFNKNIKKLKDLKIILNNKIYLNFIIKLILYFMI